MSGLLTPAGLLVLLALAAGGLFFIRFEPLLQRVFSPFQVNQGEAVNVEFALDLLRDGTLYPDPARGPYLYAAYPPLFPLLQSFLLKYSVNPWVPARLIAFGGYLGCTATLLFWGWFRWERVGAVGLAFLFLLSPTWAFWGTMARVDSFMIFIEFLAFLILLSVESKRADGQQVGAGLLTAIAVGLKQNAVLLVLAYGITCFREKRPRDFALFGLGLLPPLFLFFGYWEIKTSGLFLKYTFSWTALGYDPELLFHYLRTSFALECAWLVVIGLLSFWNSSQAPLLRTQWMVSSFWVLGLGRQGAAENYYLEFVLFTFFLMGESFLGKGSMAYKGEGRAKRFWVMGCLLGLVLMALRPWPKPPAEVECQMKAKALGYYQDPGEVLGVDLDLSLMAGKRIWIQPLEYTRMVGNGSWSTEPLLRDIRAKKFSMVELYDIPEQYLLPGSVVEEIERNYQVRFRDFTRKWYVRR